MSVTRIKYLLLMYVIGMNPRKSRYANARHSQFSAKGNTINTIVSEGVSKHGVTRYVAFCFFGFS